MRNGAITRRDALRAAAHRSAHTGQAADPERHAAPAAQGGSTPEVFISYSRRDAAVAEALAAHLKALGINVWWDSEIDSGEHFSHAIRTALSAVKVVIVIWSDTSVDSDYLLDEATFARDRRKLITTHVPGFDKAKIPFGFGQRQSECVTDRERLVRSLGRFGIHPDAGSAHKRVSAS